MKAASSRARARKLLASAAATLAATLTLGTPMAHAEDHSNSYPEGYPKVGAEAESVAGFSLNFTRSDGASGYVVPNLFTVHTSASKEGAIKAYCIEFDVNIKYESDLRVGDWKDFPGTNKFKDNAEIQSKVAWIAQRSYPQTDMAELIKASGIADLTEKEAITATQAAIWHFTNDFKWSSLKEADQATTTRVQKLFTYLTGQTNTGLKESKQPTVEAETGGITFTRSENGSEGKVGPIRFKSSQATFKLTSELKYELINAQGAKVDLNAVPADTDLYLKVPADMTSGEQEFKGSVTGSVYAGKLLITKDAVAGGSHGQTIIIGSNKEVTTEIQGKISWSVTQQTPTPEPTPTPTPTPPATETTPPKVETPPPGNPCQPTQPANPCQPTPPANPCQPSGTDASQTGNGNNNSNGNSNGNGHNCATNGTETSQTGNGHNCASNGTDANQTGNDRAANGNGNGNKCASNGTDTTQTGNGHNCARSGTDASQTGNDRAANQNGNGNGNDPAANQNGNDPAANQNGNGNGNDPAANQNGNNRSGNGNNCASSGTDASRPTATATTTVTAPAPANPPAAHKPGLPKTGSN